MVSLVVYTADQGIAMVEHGFRDKVGPYDANYSSPLIISQPGTLPQGRVSSAPVGSPDLVQTFFAQAGIPVPWTMHGRDISSVLKVPEQTDDTTVLLFEHMGQRYGSETNTIPTDDSGV